MIQSKVCVGLGMMTAGLISDAWHSMPLAQKAFPSRATYVRHVKAQHEGLETIQIAYRDNPLGAVQGGMVLLPQKSPIVGDCFVIIHNYLRADRRGSRRVAAALLREAMRVTRLNNCDWLVIPHMRGNVQHATFKEVP